MGKEVQEGKPKTLHESLLYIQLRLNATKDLYNSFGKYSYRSCESILQALKPLLRDTGTTIRFEDDVKQIGDRFYIKSTITFSNGTEEIFVSSYAREDLSKKGMDGSQITGATSSYARKYALNALFAIDDNKDADYTNEHKTDKDSMEAEALYEINTVHSISELKTVYSEWVSREPTFSNKASRVYKAVVAKGEDLKKLTE